jgi:outer membrane biosynthesis protein TonB
MPERDQKQGKMDPQMKTPLIISAVFHFIIFLLAIFGLPHFQEDPIIAEPIPVEMVANIGELTTTNKPPVKAPPKEEKKEEPPPPKKEETPPTKKEEPPAPPEDELKEPPKPEEKKEEKLPEKKPEKEPEKKPPKKPEKKPEEKKPETTKEDFDALLKNLAENQPKSETDTDQTKETSPEPSPNVSRFSDILSMSEQDALRQQLSGCWNIMAGAAGSEDLAVEIKVEVNPDRTVRSAQVVDQFRYNSDTFYRAAADSALRAVRNPQCTPLNLPPDKYDQWRTMTIVFDPKDMF